MISNKSESDKEKAGDDDSLKESEKAYFRALQQEPFDQKLQQLQQTNQELVQIDQKLKELKDLQERLEKTESKLVEILGIFTAIVVTFVGTFAFSSSVFQNMDKGDIHRLIFVVLCIAVFIASILRWLFDFLLRICGKETKCFKWWWVGIVICFLVMCYADWTNYDYNTSPCKEKGSLIGYLIHKEDCKSQNTQITTKINRFYLQLWPQEEK